MVSFICWFIPIKHLGSLVDCRGEHFPSAFSGSPLEEKHDECKCENLIMFQNLANEEVRKLTQRYILFLYYASVWNAKNIIKTGRARWLMSVIPTIWEAEVGRSPEVRSSRSAWTTWWNPVSTKSTKISWTWWHVPVIPAIQEAETGELLEPGMRRLQWAEIVPLHSSLGNRATLYLKLKKKI